jgi:hypothetical protein
MASGFRSARLVLGQEIMQHARIVSRPTGRWALGVGLVKRGVVLAGCASGLALSGCIIVTDDYDVGTFSLEWSIEGDTLGVDCDLVGARRTEVVIFDRFDQWVAELEPRCSAFGVSVDLDAGRYVAEITLVDRFDDAVSFTLVEPFRVIEDTELIVAVDFSVDDLL